jgi:hypothetical protein
VYVRFHQWGRCIRWAVNKPMPEGALRGSTPATSFEAFATVADEIRKCSGCAKMTECPEPWGPRQSCVGLEERSRELHRDMIGTKFSPTLNRSPPSSNPEAGIQPSSPRCHTDAYSATWGPAASHAVNGGRVVVFVTVIIQPGHVASHADMDSQLMGARHLVRELSSRLRWSRRRLAHNRFLVGVRGISVSSEYLPRPPGVQNLF